MHLIDELAGPTGIAHRGGPRGARVAHRHLRVGAVRDGARQQRHERVDLADRRRPRHDDPGRPARHHGVHARDGSADARRARSSATSSAATGRLRSASAIYGVGSLTTALSPNLTVLLFGWSLVEGIGAAIVLPAIVSLIAGDLQRPAAGAGVRDRRRGRRRRDRRRPADRRLGHDRVQLALRVRGRDGDRHRRSCSCAAGCARAPAGRAPPQLDVVGVALSALGLGLAVFGILKSSEWGLDRAARRPDHRRAPRSRRSASRRCRSSSSPASACLAALRDVGGAARAARVATRCWTARCCKIVPLRAGLTTLMMQQLILLGTFFVLPVYLQVVLGLDAFETGKRLFPMSVTMFIAALAGPEARSGIRAQACRAGGSAGARARVGRSCSTTIDVELNETGFAIALAIFGIGAGLLLSQLGNVIMSSVDPAKTNEAGGLQGTAQNLGASLGTALIGSVLIALADERRPSTEWSRTRRSRRRSATGSARSPRAAYRSCPSRTSSRPRSTRGCLPTRRAQSPTTTAQPSSTR